MFNAVSTSDTKKTPRIKVLMKTGTGYLTIIYDVAAYKIVVINKGSILSLLLSIDQEVI